MADTYSYKSGFRVFAENSTTNVTSDYNGIYRDDETWKNYDARKSGLLPGDFISSITLNTALRQATFMSTLLGEALANSGITGQTIDTSSVSNLTSWVTPVSRAIAYGYNLSTNNIKIGGNFNGSFTAQFGPDIKNEYGTVIPVPESCYRFTGYQNLTANTLMSVIRTNDGSLTFRENDPTDARGELYAATLHAQYGKLSLHVGMTYDNSANLLAVDDRIITMQELKQTSWLIGGEAISSSADLNSYTNIGNYYCELNNTVNTVSNFPAFIQKQAFTLKVFCGNGVSYITQRIRTFSDMEEAERFAEFITDKWVWGPWVPVSKDSYNLQSRQIYNKDKHEWEFYKKDKSTLYHLPTLTADDFPETSSKLPTGLDNPDANSTQLFFFCLLALLQPEYGKSGRAYGDSLVGLSNPNEQGNTLVYIYTGEPATATITGSAGTVYEKRLPKYSSGMWIKLNGEVIVFGTTAPSENSLTTNYYCHKIDSRYCDNIYTKSINKLDDFVNTQDIDGKTHFYLRSEFDNLTTAVHFTANIKLTDTLIIPAFSKGFIVSPTTTNDFVIYTVGTDSSINYFYNDAGPSWHTQTTGSDIRPVYMQNGRLTACKYAYTVTDALPSEFQADTIYFITEN